MPVDDDPFFDIVEGLELEEPDGDTILRVDELDDMELVKRHEAVRQELLKTGQMATDLQHTVQSTQAGRDLHSERVALLVEMTRRGLR